MAKKRLTLRDKQGNVIDYDISAARVTIDAEGKTLDVKLSELVNAIAATTMRVVFNGNTHNVNGGTINLGNQLQPDWAETSTTYPSFIKNKPDVVTGIKVGASGSTITPTNGVVTIPESGGGSVDVDNAMSASSDNPVANRVIKAYVDNLINGLINGAPAALDTLNELSAALGNDSNFAATLTQQLTLKANDANVVKSISVNGTAQQKDQNGNVNLVVETGGETVVINSDGANIVDEHSNNSVLVAPSARQMKLMYDNVMSIFNGLANTAFTNGKPTLDWVGTKTKYTLAYGTMTGCTADVAAGQVNEGALRIKLTPTQSSYAFTQVLVNGESASTTATGDADGSVYLDIVVNGNITVSATAISGRGIDFTASTGCTIDDAGVAIGEDLDTTIRAAEHYTLPASITVKIGNTNVTHTYTKAQDGKTATLHIDAANITGDLTITCTADEDAHAILNLTNVGSGVSVNKANNAHVYEGDTITILPASGNKVTASATIGGNAATLTGDTYAGYSYTIGPGDVSSGGTAIAITASATALQTFSIDLTGLVGVTSSNAATSIIEGSAYSTTLSKTDSSDSGSVIVGTCTMANGTLTINGTTISTDHVTGNIALAASVGVQPMKVHSYDVSDVTTIHDDTLDADVHYIPDTVGNFNLYSTDDTGMNAQASYGGGKYPSGYYANGIFDDSKNNGKSYRYGYGERVLDVEQGSSFTLVWKGAKQYGTDSNNYDSQQIKMLFYDRTSTSSYAAGYNRDSAALGQFHLQLSCTNKANSNTSGKMKPHITYCRDGEQKSLFSGGDSDVGVPKTFPTGVTSYDVVVAFDSSAGKTKAWVITHDTNNGDSVAYSGEVETNTIFMPCVAIKSTAVDGLDIYNYAMTQDDVEGLISNNE